LSPAAVLGPSGAAALPADPPSGRRAAVLCAGASFFNFLMPLRAAAVLFDEREPQGASHGVTTDPSILEADDGRR
jgi:hypothetical protein